ncbi:MAG: hypothetical protein ACW98Y_10395, partial [Candidatus Thorarchaeota archaeon]
MSEKETTNNFSGNKMWSLHHAIGSIKRNRILNIGIILLLALGIALPTSVFIWTETGAKITVQNYFQDNIYQFRISPDDRLPSSEQAALISEIAEWSEIELAHAIPSTVGVIAGEGIPEWDFYVGTYALGYKDARVIPVTNDMLNFWKSEFSFRGNFSLSLGEVVVSERFIFYTEMATGIQLDVGSEIGLDVLTHLSRFGYDFGAKEDLGCVRVENLTIVGVYQIKSLLGHLSSAFPSTMRHNGLHPNPYWREPVLGIDDSVLILQSELYEEDIESISEQGFFFPDILIRGSLDNIMANGAKLAPEILEIAKARLDEELTAYQILGIRGLFEFENRIEIYEKSQILTIVVFPVLIMSMMLTV